MAVYGDDWRLRRFFKGIGTLVLAAGYGLIFGSPSFAQVIPDATLGAGSSLVTSPIPDGFLIEGGATRGTNLFHSFSQFSLPTNGIAYFNNALTIQNIISRVTGTSISNIDGLIAANGTANLFLINPNGIIFGPNARLNLGGSFLASTTNSLIFGNGFEFSATNPQAPPLLTVDVPIGLQFGRNPGSIVNQSRANGFGLQVQPGRTLALVGGEVAIEGGILYAPDGRIEMGSVAGNSRVNLTPTDTGYALDYGGAGNFQDIRLSQSAIAVTSGEAGGSIQVQGRNVTLIDGSQITASTLGGGKGEGLTVNASDSVQVIGTSIDGQFASALGTQAIAGTGDAGDLSITTSRLLISGGGQVGAGTLGSGNGGNLTVNAAEDVQVLGTSVNGEIRSFLGTQADGDSTGAAGDLSITTSRLLISDGAWIASGTSGEGNGGNLTVNVSEDVQVLGTSADGKIGSQLTAQIEGMGNAGDLSITTSRLLISGGAFVSTSTFGEGRGGNLTVNAAEDVQVLGTSLDGEIRSFLGAQADRDSTGDAGDLSITTSRLFISGGAFVSAGTFGEGDGGNLTVNAAEDVQVLGTSLDGQFVTFLGTQANPDSTGAAGDVSITTSRLLISDGARIASGTFGEGYGGNLTVNASESVQVLGTSADGELASKLTAQIEGMGNAGDLSITTSRLLISGGGQVSAGTSSSGNGGNVTVKASEDVQVLGRSVNGELASKLTAQTVGMGNAGDLSITTSRLLISGGAQVSTGTFSSGNGGNLMVNAADSVQVLGTGTFVIGEISSFLGTQADGDSTGAAGDLSITTSRLLISDGGRVSAATFGEGNGGNLTVNVSEDVQVLGTSADGKIGSQLAADTAGMSNAGDLSITTSRLLISGGGQVGASTFSSGNGGNLMVNAAESVQVLGTSLDGEIRSFLGTQAERDLTGAAGDMSITTSRLLISGGAFVSAATLGQGRGGSLTVDASESVQVLGTSLDGQDLSALFVDATDVDGIAGNLTITTGQMSVREGALVSVSSPSGQAGNMTITANSLTLNQGKLTAVTGKSGAEGGANITLQGLEFLRLDNESLISATAFNQANGGNVKIDSTLVVATPPTGSNGSDISANANRGNGGRVDINTQGLFGIQFRPKLTPNNDITVSSEFGLNGAVTINQPDVDPRRGLGELPTNVVDATRQIDRRCTPTRADSRSSFVIQGRGGIPPSPNDTLQSEAVITPWITLDLSQENTNSEATSNSTHAANTAPKPLVEAQSWVYSPDGKVMLVAQAPTATPQSPWQIAPSCREQTNTQQTGGKI